MRETPAQVDRYPAACVVHWPTGPHYACRAHADQLVALGNYLGSHIVCTTLTEPHACVNCVAEAEGVAPSTAGGEA